MSSDQGPVLDPFTRTNLVQFLHDLADEIDRGQVTARGWTLETEEGKGSVVMTGERMMRVRWYDPDSRVVIR